MKLVQLNVLNFPDVGICDSKKNMKNYEKKCGGEIIIDDNGYKNNITSVITSLFLALSHKEL